LVPFFAFATLRAMLPADGPPRPMRVCLIEDHDQLRAGLVDQLEAAGHVVCAAVASVAAARDAVRLHVPDVAVVDDHLPDGSGVGLCRLLTRGHPGLTVVIHAGTVDEALEVAGRAAGALAVVQKSVRGRMLLAVLDALRPPRRGGGRGSHGVRSIPIPDGTAGGGGWSVGQPVRAGAHR
jgi:DNA-binding response OmpR family regulator